MVQPAIHEPDGVGQGLLEAGWRGDPLQVSGRHDVFTRPQLAEGAQGDQLLDLAPRGLARKAGGVRTDSGTKV